MLTKRELLILLSPRFKKETLLNSDEDDLNKMYEKDLKTLRKYNPDEFTFYFQFKEARIRYDDKHNYTTRNTPLNNTSVSTPVEHKKEQEEYVRPPDPVKRERLIDDDYNYNYNNINPYSTEYDDDIEQALINEALDEALQEYEEDKFLDEICNASEKEKEEEVMSFDHLEPPEDFDRELLSLLYKRLKDCEFAEARTLIEGFNNWKVESWLFNLKYNGIPLRQHIKNENPDAYRCLEA